MDSSRRTGAAAAPAFIDTSELSSLSGSRDSPVTCAEHPSITHESEESLDMSFRASQSQQRKGANQLTASTLSERLTMMNIPMQELKGTAYYGWLWKKGSSFKTWKKRFFLLHGRALTYYTQTCVIASDALGTQCLDVPAKGGLRVQRVELSDETKYGLKVTSTSGRILHIQAGDQDARMQWLEVLEEAPRRRLLESTVRSTLMSEYPSARLNTPFDETGSSDASSVEFQSSLSTMSSDDEGEFELSDKNGWLQIRGGMLLSWKKRYVTLVDGNITITSHRRSKRPQDKSYAVVSCTPYSSHQHAFCVRLDRHKELYMSASSEAEADAWIDAFKNCL
jgi:hypothetical protein|uniref:PH domain-containing protein n=1 Tax=Globisporangium ultimum (strain ATCC 200006 / CBS 805.95 / DAOM BR144) TaxID=431595 RepID=K3WW48_GLOUD